ncbi:MAG: KH domain-containing protein [Acidimicrobiales bacterium]
MGASAPKVISFEIPIDKIGEVIGPKGKVINAIQAETGADISVDDDGMVGTVSIGTNDLDKVNEAERQIRLILNPPTAEVADLPRPRGQHHQVRGVRQHPPRPRRPGPHLQDGWRQAHRQGRGRARAGQQIDVKVDDVDPSSKVSLTPVTPLVPGGGSSGGGGSDDADDGGSSSGSGSARESVSFEDSFFLCQDHPRFGEARPGAERPSAAIGAMRGPVRLGPSRRWPPRRRSSLI